MCGMYFIYRRKLYVATEMADRYSGMEAAIERLEQVREELECHRDGTPRRYRARS
jgi:hypothetical protein